MAVSGAGWIAVQASDGTEAYTRAGDLRVDPSGLLTTALGNPVLGDAGPIRSRRRARSRSATTASVSIVPQGQPAASISVIGRIKLVNPPAAELARGADGLFRSTSGTAVPADASVRLAPGTLESSNVNIAETMTNMIELARSYEVQIKAMKAAEDNAASSTKLLQPS